MVLRAILTNLFKTFDCICHDHLVAKLHAYGLCFPALKLMQDYLGYHNQRPRSRMSYSTLEKILSGVPQGSIFGPLFFNIFLCDLFLINTSHYFNNSADDTTSYLIGDNTTSANQINLYYSKVIYMLW